MIKAIGGIGKVVKAYMPEPYKGELLQCPYCDNSTYITKVVQNALMECSKCKGRFYVDYDICNKKLNVTKLL